MDVFLRILLGVLLLIVVLVVVSLVVDALLRRNLWNDISIDVDINRGGVSPNDTLIVYFPGILAGARASIVDFFGTFQQYGHVMLVEYGGDRFSGPDVVDEVTHRIHKLFDETEFPYRRILFVGSSMGGLLTYDVVRRLRLDESVSVDVLLLDAPTSSRDFAFPNNLIAPVLRFLPFGPLWNRLNLVGKMFVPPREENIEKGVDRNELARRIEWGGAYRLSFYRDQILYIVRHGVPSPGSLQGLVDHLNYVTCTRNNETIRPSAYLAWFATTTDSRNEDLPSTHVGFAEMPRLWRSFFARKLSDLLG